MTHALLSNMATAKSSAESLLQMKAAELAHLQAEESLKRREFEGLRNQLHNLQAHLAAEQAGVEELSQAKESAQSQLSQVTVERDQLSEQLHNTHQAYDLVEAELGRMRAERDKARLDLASLDTRIEELTARNQEDEQHLKANEQYLASDRDIRDLMSARNLYIADVFDVDGHSRTRKPFGRVFFTRGKSLLFYAYDLDQAPQLKSAAAFQVWGQRDTGQNEGTRPVDLGILYQDSEANRRWFMRFDDPRTLSEIDSVFVTIEPHGGSREPTGKPLLFATLRRKPNHP
jgi:archaellum component FlaC